MTMSTRPSLHELAETREAPAVSIVCPLDPARPGNTRDPLELAALHKAVVAYVRSEFGDANATTIDTQIAGALQLLDLQHPPAGVAVFADANTRLLVPLTHAAEPRFAVGTRFSLREVLASQSDHASFLVLVVTRERARCLGGDTFHLREIEHAGFPMLTSAPVEADTPHRDFPLSEREDEEAVLFALREAARGLRDVARLMHARAVVLVGTTRDLSYFDELDLGDITRIADVHGNHIDDTAEKLTALVAPAVAQHTRAVNASLIREAREAIGSGALDMPGSALDAARSGRGRRLFVQQPAAGPATAGDTTIDEIIGEVLVHDGDVCVVEPGTLGATDSLVLTLRY